MKRLAISTSVLVVVASGCASVPVPKMEHKESSGIVISVQMKAPLGWPTYDAQKVYFIKLDSSGNILRNEVIASNYNKKGMVYLLNVEQGDYAAVAAWMKGSSQPGAAQPGFSVTFTPNYKTFFPQGVIELTRVSVGKGQMVCAGEYLLKTSLMGEREPIQQHYEGVISWSAGVSWRGENYQSKNDAGTRGECLNKAKAELSGSGWETIIH